MIVDWEKWTELKDAFPVVDVRSPGEFARGHIPQAYNIPLLEDEERAAVGKAYRRAGREEAIKVGFERVTPRLEKIIDKAKKIAGRQPLCIYCWRGGLRSSFFCQFMEKAGLRAYRLRGGYSAYRKEAFALFALPFRIILVTGYTGSGKSQLLETLSQQGQQVIHLERLANHKGSTFGGLGMPSQPSTEQFQNLIFEKMRAFDTNRPTWLEDESIAIGKVFIPENLWRTMRQSPVVLWQLEKTQRIQRLVEEYGRIDAQTFYVAMKRIARKMGGQNFKEASHHLTQKNMKRVIEILLLYYDKAYRQSLEKRVPQRWHTIEWEGKNIVEAAQRLIQFTEQRIHENVSTDI